MKTHLNLDPGAGLEVGPTHLGLRPHRRPYLLPEPGEINPYNFQHFSRSQPSISHPNVESESVGKDEEHKTGQPGARTQDPLHTDSYRELGRHTLRVLPSQS